MRHLLLLIAALPCLNAEVKLPAIISSHMVLQQKMENPIWGWDNPGTRVNVTFDGQTYSGTAGTDGKWMVKLAPITASFIPRNLSVAGSSRVEVEDVLVGEVWMCSGQSNMQFSLDSDWNGQLEIAATNFPSMRLIEAPLVGTQEIQNDLKRGPGESKSQWRSATPASVARFSAVGFFFGRYLHQALNVPVGLIHNSWGGSSAEAWVRRSTLEADPRFKDLMEFTKKREDALLSDAGKAAAEKAAADYKIALEKSRREKTAPPRGPDTFLTGQNRAGNIFAGMLYATLGYGIKGAIWYQGESNAGKAYEYKSLFPFMIEQWRKEQGQGDFSFYWVQLADYQAEKPNPGESSWAELREAQTQTMKLANTGQAVITDLGEGKDIHPKNKHDVAARLVRWALVKDYGLKMAYRSPEYKSMTVAGNKATITLDTFGSSLRAFDVADARGFAVCGADKQWKWAKGKVTGKDTVEVWSDEVAAPVAVRFAWADNPVFNLFSMEGLPVTPFRTDDFPMTTAPKAK